MIKEACQTHTGITEGTFFRDQGWYFYRIGRNIERADQTTRLLDIKYHLLLPRHGRCRLADRCRPMECAAALGSRLSCVSPIASRRQHAGGGGGLSAAQPTFPRSVYHCVQRGGPAAGRGQVAPWAAPRQRRGRGARGLQAVLGALRDRGDFAQRAARVSRLGPAAADGGEPATSRSRSSAHGREASRRRRRSHRATHARPYRKHLTTYRYKQPVAFGEHRMMLRPRDCYDQKLLEAKLVITPEPTDIRWVHDVFGNCVAVRPVRRAGAGVALRERDSSRAVPARSPRFQIEEYARRYPFTYGADEMPDLLRAMERQYLDPRARSRPVGAAVLAP